MPRQASVVVALLVAAISSSHAIQTAWPGWGGDLDNTRLSDHCVNTAALKTGMSVKWAFNTAATVASTPSVCGGFVYALDFAGNVYKFKQNPGATSPLVWRVNVKSYVQTTGVRSTPVFSANCAVMYTFTMGTPLNATIAKGVYMLALRTSDGLPVYPPRLIDNHPFARATQSPTMFQGFIYIGMSSTTENSGTVPTFRGSMFKIRAADGAVIWRTFTTPPGYSGNPIWGSAPVVDRARNQVCVGTGNNYALPAAVLACLNKYKAFPQIQPKCVSSQNFVDALICFDLGNGRVKWGRPLHGLNVFVSGNGMDYDFAQAPILVNGLLIAASKAGAPFALRAVDGVVVWKGAVKVNGLPVRGASSMFGSCSNRNVFVMGLFWFEGTTNRGVVAAFNVRNGAQVWVRDFGVNAGGIYGPLTCTHNVVFAPLMNGAGSLFALDIGTGVPLGNFNTGASLFCGPAIVQGTMYMGNGYPFNGGSPGNKFWAVNLPLRPQPVPGRC